MRASERTNEILSEAYRELSELQSQLGAKVVKQCVYPPTSEVLDAMKEHGYVMEAMTAVLRIIKYRKGILNREGDE